MNDNFKKRFLVKQSVKFRIDEFTKKKDASALKARLAYADSKVYNTIVKDLQRAVVSEDGHLMRPFNINCKEKMISNHPTSFLKCNKMTINTNG